MIKLIHLQSKHHSVIIKTDRVPEILHWGAKIAHIDEDLLLSTERPISQARLDVDVPLSLCPELGSGHFNAPGIEGHRHGFDWAPVFHCVATEEQAGGVTFRLVDETAALELIIELRLNPETDVLQKCVSVTNLGESQYCLSKLSATLPLPNHANELMTFHGRWCHEFHTQRQRFEHGGFMQENRRGRTSHENFPGVLPVPTASVKNSAKSGGSILVGVVTTKCEPMFAVMGDALFKPVNYCSRVRSSYNQESPTKVLGYTAATATKG